MSDTHDEPGGDADPYDWDPVYAAATIAELRKQLAAETERADLAEAQVVETQAERSEWQRRAQRGHVVAEVLRADLTAAIARAESATVLPERWRALIAERDEARELARVSLDILRNVSDEPMRELFEVDDMDELPDWFTGYGKPSSAQDADAAQEARSATETAEGSVQASGSELEFEGRSAGLSEACGNKLDYHVCFLPAGHDGDHRDSLNWEWRSYPGIGSYYNTTEDDRG